MSDFIDLVVNELRTEGQSIGIIGSDIDKQGSSVRGEKVSGYGIAGMPLQAVLDNVYSEFGDGISSMGRAFEKLGKFLTNYVDKVQQQDTLTPSK